MESHSQNLKGSILNVTHFDCEELISMETVLFSIVLPTTISKLFRQSSKSWS